MQGLRGGVWAVVAEKHRVAFLRGHLQPHVGEGGATALGGVVQVHHQRAHALAAALQNGGGAGLGGVKVVVVGLVLRAGLVVQHLHALAVFNRPVQQAGDAVLDAADELGFVAPEKHPIAGAVGIDGFASGVHLDRERAGQPRLRGGHDGIALVVAEQAAEHHHPGFGDGQQHVHQTVSCVNLAW